MRILISPRNKKIFLIITILIIIGGVSFNARLYYHRHYSYKSDHYIPDYEQKKIHQKTKHSESIKYEELLKEVEEAKIIKFGKEITLNPILLTKKELEEAKRNVCSIFIVKSGNSFWNLTEKKIDKLLYENNQQKYKTQVINAIKNFHLYLNEMLDVSNKHLLYSNKEYIFLNDEEIQKIANSVIESIKYRENPKKNKEKKEYYYNTIYFLANPVNNRDIKQNSQFFLAMRIGKELTFREILSAEEIFKSFTKYYSEMQQSKQSNCSRLLLTFDDYNSTPIKFEGFSSCVNGKTPFLRLGINVDKNHCNVYFNSYLWRQLYVFPNGIIIGIPQISLKNGLPERPYEVWALPGEEKRAIEITKEIISQWSDIILDRTISNWKTYKNESFGYEIKYPQIDTLIKDDGGCASDKDIIFYEEKNKGKWGKYTFMWMRPMWFPSNVEVDLNESLENLLKKKYSLKKLSIGVQKKETAAGELDYVEKIIIGENMPAYKVHILTKDSKGGYLGICEYFAKCGNKAIEISRINPDLTYTSCDEDMLFNQMLSTFKFTE